MFPRHGRLTPHEEEIRRLERRLKVADQESGILRRAIAIFSPDDWRGMKGIGTWYDNSPMGGRFARAIHLTLHRFALQRREAARPDLFTTSRNYATGVGATRRQAISAWRLVSGSATNDTISAYLRVHQFR